METTTKSKHNNLKNVVLALVVPLPSILFYLYFLRHHSNPDHLLASLWSWCYRHPFLLTFVLYFLNINVLFWAIANIQSNHWIFMMGVTLPYYIIHTVEAPWSIWDVVAVAICLTGIIVAYYADTQLHDFSTKNAELKASEKPTIPILQKGLWQYSRHPNYFGEQLWWWGLGILAWSLGQGWILIGALVNTLCLLYVATLVEERMLKQSFRAEAYKEYQKTTSVCIPWFKSSSVTKDKTG
ncbi:hypothetical protein KSS87_020661 [Heliosperma pusillum]|nr:hypothetical protein KSS87_020661 [Heliosperma pusillum]